jgi:hypothetical protein
VAVIDSAGDTTRTFRIDNGKHESVNSISFFSNGDLAIVGVSEDSLHSDNDDQFIMRMDTNGVTAWYRLFTDTVGQELFNDVYVHLDTMIAVGSRNGNGAGAYDFHVVKFKPDGYYYSAHTFGAADDEKCNRIISTTGTGYALVGITTSFGPGSQSILLIRTDSMFNSAANFVIDVEKIETKKNISVYPNPSTGKIHIAINKKIPGLTINIYDISGNLIYSKGDNEINSALDIKLKSGIYLAEFSANNTIEIKKIIIQE